MTDRTPTEYRDPVQLAAAAFLARYKTNSRRTYAVALRTYLNWCRLSDGALVVMLGMLGLRSFEAGKARIEDLGEEHGHRVLSVLGKGDKKVLIPLPPAVARMIDRAVGDRMSGPICLNQIVR